MLNTAIIVGAGVNGLCLAEALVEQGYKVKVFDQDVIPSPNAPSCLEAQIVRPQYVENPGLGMRIKPAIDAWRELFCKLGENFFKPTGVVAISRREGDWADQALRIMREQNLPFRYVHGTILKDLFPGLELEHIRMGVLADIGGHIRGRDLMFALYQYLTEKGVEFHPRERVEYVEIDQGSVETAKRTYEADWIIVTSSHYDLLSEMGFDTEEFLGCFCDLAPPPEYKHLWRFSPIWVDLGGEENCWGIPRLNGDGLRVGAGIYSDRVDEMDSDIASSLESLYGELIREFHRYKIDKFERVSYSGFSGGELIMRRQNNVLGLAADSGHGFKFAAQNAQFIVEALENDTLTMAARKIAGV